MEHIYDVKDYDYELPEELIAQDPLEDRTSSRLMVLNKHTGEVSHHHFYDIKDYLKPGDCLVLNNTKVIPARLYGVKEDTGAAIEILLLKREEDSVWECLVRPGKKCRVGAKISFGDGLLHGEIIEVLADGNRKIRFTYEGIFEEILDQLGEMPLPPYITHKLQDKNRYQTVYAKYDGSAAAPTAGLHFTEDLLQQIRDMGVQIAEVTLHVGLGTFRPVKVDNILDHQMHSEYYQITQEACDIINSARAAGGRVISVGTTSTRTLESVANAILGNAKGLVNSDADEKPAEFIEVDGRKYVKLVPQTGWTEIFIYPGYEFQVIDGLITNFHLPESTLIMLVSALAGREHVLSAYQQAVKEKYRFFSFGDAMFIEP